MVNAEGQGGERPLSEALIERLVCPATRQPLGWADELVDAPDHEVAEGYLVRDDGTAAYPVRRGVAHLSADFVILLCQ